MSRLWLLVVALVACASAPAFAQNNRGEECWNPRAGHFEGVRPGERQNDLDFTRCRPIGYPHGEREVPRECWNPHARCACLHWSCSTPWPKASATAPEGADKDWGC